MTLFALRKCEDFWGPKIAELQNRLGPPSLHPPMKTTSRNGILHLEAISKPKKDAWEHGTPWDIMGYYGQVPCSASFQRQDKFANGDFQQAMMEVSVACTRLNAAVSLLVGSMSALGVPH